LNIYRLFGKGEKMRTVLGFMVGALVLAGCARDSNETKPVAQSGTQGSMVVSKSEEGLGSEFEGTSTAGACKEIQFEEVSTLGRGDHIVVKKLGKVGPGHSQYERLKGRHVLVTIGWISKGPGGVYRYYKPETNELNPMFVETDLSVLKEKIVAHYSNR
jgi:hypothetical protein